MPAERITDNGILIIDPSQHMLDIVAAMARHLRFRDIRLATTTDIAAAELGRRPFRFILIDSAAGPTDAALFVQAVRRSSGARNQFTPVIMMSSAPDAARIAEARDAGITEFLRKPFAATHLETRIKSILEAPRSNLETETYAGPDRRRRPPAEMGAAERRR